MIIEGRQSRLGQLIDLFLTGVGWWLTLYFAYQFVLLALNLQPNLIIDWLRNRTYTGTGTGI